MVKEADSLFFEIARRKGLLDETQVDELLAAEDAEAAEKGKLVLRSEAPLRRVVPATLAAKVVARGMMTESQARDVQRELLPEKTPRSLGGFEIVEELGKGGMGAVYKAWNPRLESYVAIKTLIPQLAANDAFIKRFQREAKLGAKLHTPHAVRVFDVGEEDGVQYIIMDYIEGESLADVLSRETKLDEKAACAITADAARALEAAQKQNIIHRDIKPANIMVDREGMVKLADLGIAKQLTAPEDDEASKQLSLTVGVIGTPTYMSPEQATGLNLDFRTDIYSLGATLYHLVCGGPPYQGVTPQAIMVKVAHDPVPDPRLANPELSQPVAGVICKMMSKAPGLRYQTHAELIADLESCAQGRRPKASYVRTVTCLAGPPPTEDALPRAAVPHRWRMLWFAGAAALLLAVIAAGVIWSFNREPATPSQSLREGPPAQPAGRRSNLPVPPEPKPPKPVTLADVVPTKSQAEMAWDRVRGLERGQGFGAFLVRAESTYRTAAEFYQQTAFGEAKAAYEKLLAECRGLTQRETERRAAMAAKVRAEDASKAAVRAGAEHEAAALFKGGGDLAKAASEKFESGALSDAERGWRRAEEQYAKAQEHAQAAQRRRTAKAAYQAALRRYDRRKLEQYGGAAWQRVAQAVNAAEAAGVADAKALMEGARGYERAAKLLAAADKAADVELRRRYDSAMQKGKELFTRGKWRDAESAFGEALKVPGYDNDRKAKEAIARAIGGREAEGRRVAYEAALKEAQAGYARARGTRNVRLWQSVKDRAERAVKTGHTETAEAQRLIAEANKHLRPPWAKVSDRQIQVAAKAGVPVAKEIDLGGGVTMKFVYIPPGRFVMGGRVGRPRGSVGSVRPSEPRHPVVIRCGFYMGIHEVTQAEWRAVMGSNPSRLKGDTKPVEWVSWNDCQEFIRKLNARGSGRFRLPTEAEWEYACRAGTTTKYYWGELINDAYAWHDGNSGKRTHAVGRKLPNAFGLYDMSGNVLEWCQSKSPGYEYPYRPDDGRESLQGNTNRILRGGSWDGNSYSGGSVESAARHLYTQSGLRPDTGFRIVWLSEVRYTWPRKYKQLRRRLSR